MLLIKHHPNQKTTMPSTNANWEELPLELWERIGSNLSANELACTLKLLNKNLLALFKAFLVVRLSELVPRHAFVWQWSRAVAFYALTRKNREQLVILTARSGCLSNLEFILAAVGQLLTEDVFYAAAGSGNLDMCIWLYGNSCPFDFDEAVAEAAKCGHLAVVRWLLLQLDTGWSSLFRR